MFSAACLILSASVLFFVLKFRVHIHVEYTPTKTGTQRRNVAGASTSKSRVRTSGEVPPRVAGFVPGMPREAPARADAPRLKDLTSALVNLGTPKPAAKEAAQRAMFHQDPQFETALRRAIDYASRSNAA